MKQKLTASVDFDFELFAIISSAKEYKVAFFLNETLKIRLTKTNDIIFDYNNKANISFSHFVFQTEHITFRFIKNESIERVHDVKKILIPELKEFQFFLLINDKTETLQKEEIVKKIKRISIIQHITHINILDLKSKENLIV